MHTLSRWINKMPSDTEARLQLAEGSLDQTKELYRVRALMFAKAMSMASVQQVTELYQDR